MTSKDESQDTRMRLIGAARKLMADGGFDGTSIRALTEEAGANLGAVTYHFGSKEGLYNAVLDEVLAPFRDQVQLLRDMPMSPLSRLEYFIRGMFEHLRENPDMPRFMVQEIVLGNELSPLVSKTIGTVFPILVGIIQEGQAVGAIRKGDATLMALSALSQPVYLTIVPPILGSDALKAAGVPQPRKSPEDHGVEFVLKSLTAKEEDSE